MIYTCTLNPSVDYVVSLAEMIPGQVNRAEQTHVFPGGKGINVSRVLKRLGTESIALGFVSGFTGEYIRKQLTAEAIQHDFIDVEGFTRINVKVHAATETELNGEGPTIRPVDLQAFFAQLGQLTSDDVVILSGSVPKSMKANFYLQVAEFCSERNIPFIVDIAGPMLRQLLPYRPLLIKPNHHELGELFQAEITTREAAITFGQQLCEEGAQHVIVSLAGDGAVLVTKEEQYIADVPKGKVVNSVGAGDSVVAGFTARYMRDRNVKEAFIQGVASGSATAFSADLCTAEKVASLIEQVNIQF